MRDRLRPELLNDALAATVWRDVEVRDQVVSTNDVLMADPRIWRVVTADHQTSGRGRLDRRWEAPAGTSIALSVSLPLPTQQSRWGWVPLLTGLAVRRAVADLAAVPLGLKWPNDVLAKPGVLVKPGGNGDHEDGQPWHKVAGVLCSVAAGVNPVVVIGIGLNVHQTQLELPTEQSTSLALCGVEVTREELILAILRELVVVQRVWATAQSDDDYRAACVTIGQQVQLQTPEGTIAGEAVGVDASGRILISHANRTDAYSVGDVVHVRPSEPPVSRGVAAQRVAADDAAEFVDKIDERLMGHPRTMRRGDISEASGIPAEVSAQIWRSLGFVRARGDELFFGQADIEALRLFDDLISEGAIDLTTAFGLARAVGRSTDRMAMWSLQLIADLVSEDRGGLDRETAKRTAALTVDLAGRLSPLVDYVWRRNLSIAISRMIADSEPESQVGIVRTVGFADLVNFTNLVRRLTERELAQLVLRFESVASDVIGAGGGAVVKTVGDEVLFTHTSVQGAVDIAFALREAAEADELVPRMRVGLARGRVLARLGDVFGTTVNRASRLTVAAKPGRILVDADVVKGLDPAAGVHARRRKRVELAGIGPIDTWVLERGPTEPDPSP